MDNVVIIQIVAGILALAVFGVWIAYVAFLSGILRKCHPQSRTMEPGMVWLLLIPVVSIVWNFFVITALAKSLGNEFRLRNVPTGDYEPGKSVGIGMAVCGACSIVPFVNFVAIPAHLILWIIYWVKIAGFSKTLDSIPGIAPATAYGD